MLAITILLTMQSNVSPPKPFGPVPSERQLSWQNMEMNAFVHFGPNTFTGREWGQGTEDPNVFNPTDLDCKQWVKAFKDAGMKGVVITAKHHDGFCLWPSKESTHTVAQSSWKSGQGDVLRDLSQACREAGLKFGVYVSPWDRNHPAYGSDAYIEVFKRTLGEVLGNYGEAFEMWFDGANGEGPNGRKQVYDWPGFIGVVRAKQPKAVIFSDGGPDIRWVGNEQGYAPETCWATLNRDGIAPGTSRSNELGEGHKVGTHWVPAECDVSIRPGWFWRESENSKVKTVDQLEDIWYGSVGRNANLLLNVPPDTRGHIADPDLASLKGLHERLAATFKTDLARSAKPSASSTRGNAKQFGPANALDGKDTTYWATDDAVKTGWVELDFGKPTVFDRVWLAEEVRLGQRVEEFKVEAMPVGSSKWLEVGKATTIGFRRVLRTQAVKATKLRITITKSLACPTLSRLSVYASPDAALDAQMDTPEQHDQRMKWFREARFGMFIHWGLYAVPAGTWNGKKIGGAGEWILNSAQIKVADYEPLLKQFNPVKYDARKWVRIAKDAGMKYMVITSKHHDGFNLFDSKETDWDVMSTPYGKDILKQLAEACKAEGMKLCFYHSIMDWHHPDYLPRRPWDPRPEIKPNYERYIQYLKAELKELLTNYGPIGILWFDGEWEASWTHERGKDLYHYVRSLQPNIIINNRVDKGRSGMAGMTVGDHMGDYGTPEQEIPANGLPGMDWESCMTMNDTWGYVSFDQHWKSSTTLLHNLIDCASKGGNYLLNVGPTELGEIPPASVERLHTVGTWLKSNGEAVYGTQAGPFPRPLAWGRVTSRKGKLYLCVFDESASSIELPGLKTKITKAYALRDPKLAATVTATDDGFSVAIPKAMPAETVRVIVVECQGPVKVDSVAQRPDASGLLALQASDAVVTGSAHFEADKKCIGFWTGLSDTVSWDCRFAKPGDYAVVVTIACEPGSQGSEFEVRVGNAAVKGIVPDTGSWSKFVRLEMGSLKLAKAGPMKVTVKALSKPGMAVMNLRSVELKAGPN